MAKLKRFYITKTYRYPAAIAANLATFGGIFGSKANPHRVASSHYRLRTLYRKWLEKLYDADPSPIRDEKELVVMKNCPPWGVVTADTTIESGRKLRPCGKQMFCPYCRARYTAMRAYNVLAHVAFPHRDKQWGEKSDLFLTVCRNTLLYDTSASYAVATIKEIISDKKERGKFFDTRETIAGAVVFTIDIVPNGIKFVKGVIALSKPGVPIEPPYNLKYQPGAQVAGRARVFNFDGFTRTELAAAVAKITRYPKGWLREPNAEWVNLVTEKFHHVRMLSTYGAAFKNGYEEEGEEQ